MKNHGSHPGRSADFLSRLYDGELTAAERTHFESHRSHCAECRSAASEFESALSFFRSSRPSPPSPDLAARILRKLQASTPRRSPFGVFFGINLKWAGAFAAALIAMIIGSSIVLRQEVRPKSDTASATIPVVMQEEKKEKDEARLGKSAPAPVVARAPVSSNSEPASKVESRDKASAFDATLPEKGDRLARSEPRLEAPATAEDFKVAKEESRRGYLLDGKSEAPAAASAPAAAGVAAKMAEAPAQRQLKAQERAGGEGAVQGSATFLDQAAPPPRLIISSIDGRGTTPELSDEEKPQTMADLRGREYVLTVNSQGRVTAVRARGGKKAPRPDLGTERAVQEAQAPPALMNLRFKPTDHPRLLLVRIE